MPTPLTECARTQEWIENLTDVALTHWVQRLQVMLASEPMMDTEAAHCQTLLNLLVDERTKRENRP